MHGGITMLNGTIYIGIAIPNIGIPTHFAIPGLHDFNPEIAQFQIIAFIFYINLSFTQTESLDRLVPLCAQHATGASIGIE
jgi:hypothetical protein